MSYLSYHSFPQNANLSRRSSAISPQVNGVDSDSRSAHSALCPPVSGHPMLADARNFSAHIPDLASALYGLPYGNQNNPASSLSSLYPGLPPGIDLATLQATLARMDPKDIPNAWRTPQPPQIYPALTALVYQGGYPQLALAEGVRRKNATRETTATLKTWLNQHRKNPYPTKAEKTMLAIISRMTLTQVSTWFANARRRLKKENRMTWSPRTRCGDGRDSGDEDAGKEISTSAATSLEDEDISASPSNKDGDDCVDDSPMELHNNLSERSNIPYQHYQQQMILQHLVSLPPHLRSPEVLRQLHEQSQRSSAPSRVPDLALRRSLEERTNRSSSESRPFVQLPAKQTSANKDDIHRRSSVGSPSTSSYDRSPSPLHRSSSSYLRPPAWHHAQPDTKTILSPKRVSSSERTNGDTKIPMQSSDDKPKSKPKIWSPASMALENTKDSSQTGQSRKSPTAKQTCTKSRSPQSTHGAFHFPKVVIEEDCSKDVLANKLYHERSIADEKFEHTNEKPFPSFPTISDARLPVPTSAALDWMREYNKHLASNGSIPQPHTFTANMKPFISDNHDYIHSNLLEKLHYQRFVGPNSFNFPDFPGNNQANGDNSRSTSSSSRHQDEAATSDSEVGSDAPMNLSKNRGQQSNFASFSASENAEHKLRTPSVTAN